MYREKYWRERAKRYFHTYRVLGLGLIWTPYGESIREGFLYQEPNPDYDKWYPENCTPVYFKDWIWDKIPEGMIKPKPGPKAKAGEIKPRPLICIETGKYYPSVKAAYLDGYSHAKDVAKGDSSSIFDHECRFTFVDPFMPWDDEPWTGFITYENRQIKRSNNAIYTTVDEKEFSSMALAARYLAEQTGYSFNTIHRKVLYERIPLFKDHKIKYSK